MTKPTKFTIKVSTQIDLGTKIIHKYPTPLKEIDIAKMAVNGRHPQNGNFIIEHECTFVIYVIKGSGKVWAGKEIFEVTAGDVVFVPKETAFAVEGKLEYITVDTPAYYPEQAEEISTVS